VIVSSCFLFSFSVNKSFGIIKLGKIHSCLLYIRYFQFLYSMVVSFCLFVRLLIHRENLTFSLQVVKTVYASPSRVYFHLDSKKVCSFAVNKSSS
jgi:hypothetical protein